MAERRSVQGRSPGQPCTPGAHRLKGGGERGWNPVEWVSLSGREASFEEEEAADLWEGEEERKRREGGSEGEWCGSEGEWCEGGGCWTDSFSSCSFSFYFSRRWRV